MDDLMMRQQLRATLVFAGTAAAEVASLTGKKLSPEEVSYLSKPVRGLPRVDKPEIVQVDGIGAILPHSLDVLRVLRANFPAVLDSAILIVRDAEIAESEAPEVKIAEDRTITQAASA